MTTELTNGAAAKPRSLKDLIQGQAFKDAVGAALPKHLKADRFCRVASTALLRVPKLAQCDQASFFNCLLTLSQYGLEPDGRNAHLIPFENRKAGITECQLILDYKGLVELAMRSGLIATIHADVVCENDDFEYDLGEIKRHRIDLRQSRGAVYAAYALVKFRDGSTKCEVLSRDDIESVRKRSRAGSSGPWVSDWNEMAKKTCFRRLSKWISISSEFRDAVDTDDDIIETTAGRPRTQIADLVSDLQALPDQSETILLEPAKWSGIVPTLADVAGAMMSRRLDQIIDEAQAAMDVKAMTPDVYETLLEAVSTRRLELGAP